METAALNTTWNTSLYEDRHAFVFKYGEGLVEMLAPQPGERILDLGCGTGYLSNVIAAAGATVTGIDNSPEMISKAKEAYPDIEFEVLAGEGFYFDQHFDAIFSNAALHWMLEKEKVIDCMYRNLKRTGRLVLEMGGKHNVEKIIIALQHSLLKRGYTENAARQPWYFPSLGEYTSLLEKRGFRVTWASHFDRATKLVDTKDGIKDWVKMFGSSFLNGIDEVVVADILTEVQDVLKPELFRDNNWYADYKRLRVVAIK